MSEYKLPEPESRYFDGFSADQMHQAFKAGAASRDEGIECDRAILKARTAVMERQAAEGKVCTSDEWLSNCPQSVRDLANKMNAEQFYEEFKTTLSYLGVRWGNMAQVEVWVEDDTFYMALDGKQVSLETLMKDTE